MFANPFKSFLSDVNKKLGRRFFLLVILSSLVALSDGLRILLAFQLLPFIGVPASGNTNVMLSEVMASIGITYNLTSTSILVISAFIIQATLALTLSWFHGTYANYYTMLWRRELFDALAKVKWSFFINNSRGEVINIIANETGRLSSTISKFLTFLSNSLISIVYIISSFFISFQASLMLIGVGFIAWIFNVLFVSKLMEHAKQIVKGNNQMMMIAQEFLNNIKPIKVTANKFNINGLISSPLQTIFTSERSGYMLPNASKIIAELFVMILVVLGIVAINILEVDAANSELLLVFVLFIRAYSKMTMTMTAAQQMLVLLPSYEIIAATYQETKRQEESNWDQGEEFDRDSLKHGISIENVTVKLSKKTALENINFYIPPCEIVALVGASGSGKTTFVDTLLRLHEPTSGQLLLNGEKITKINLKSWRACFGYVTQELNLVNGTIFDNVTLFHPHASLEEVKKACDTANASEFIQQLPDGFNTHIGESGLKLSGGQRQRIIIARTLITDPSIIIFDEATSALDPNTENQILESLFKMRMQKTIIIIAHRLSTLKMVDKIVVLDKGQITEQGTWDNLIEKNGKFCQLLGHEPTL